MKTRKIIVEIICLILLLNFFYEGMYKLVYIHNYGQWLKYAPFLESVSTLFTYTIPIGEILLSILFIYSRYRIIALNICLTIEILFVLWIMSVYLFSHSLFWPYHALWEKPTWMQKMLISIGLCWLAFIAIILSNPRFSFKRYSSNSLRNTPVNAR